MTIEEDMLSASMALTAVAGPCLLPRALICADGMFADADAELAALLRGEAGDDHWEDDMCSGRANPAALHIMSSAHDLVLMHARRPEGAVHVPAQRL
jgi:hypothetical protein